jgi:hypothetical protein
MQSDNTACRTAIGLGTESNGAALSYAFPCFRLDGAFCRTTDAGGDLLPERQHLLLFGRAGVGLDEIAGPAGQPPFIAPSHVSHLWRRRPQRRLGPNLPPHFIAKTRTGRSYCPSRTLRTMVEASACVGSVST